MQPASDVIARVACPVYQEGIDDRSVDLNEPARGDCAVVERASTNQVMLRAELVSDLRMSQGIVVQLQQSPEPAPERPQMR